MPAWEQALSFDQCVLLLASCSCTGITVVVVVVVAQTESETCNPWRAPLASAGSADLSIYLSINLSIYLSTYRPIIPIIPVILSICLFVYLSFNHMCIYIYICINQPTHIYKTMNHCQSQLQVIFLGMFFPDHVHASKEDTVGFASKVCKNTIMTHEHFCVRLRNIHV